jgi:MFS family permease
MIQGPLLSPAGCQPHPPGCCTQRNSAPYELGRRASFWVAAGVVAHTLWTSAAPAMIYPLFAEQWHLTHTVTTGIFAIYPIVVAAVLIGFGDVSDYVGRRTAILWGVGASLIGSLLFALAPDVLWLFAGRALMGIGVGLTAGPSTAAMVEFSGQGAAKRAATITTAAQAVGFAAALLLGGALIQYAPLPTRLNFLVLSAVLAALFAAAWFLPRHTGSQARGRWRPKTPFIPNRLRKVFAVAAAAVTSAYTHGVLILSLGSQVAHDLVGSPNSLVNGAALSLFAIASAVVGIGARTLQPRTAMTMGAAASTAGMALLAAAVAHHHLPVFLAATAISGAGYSLLFFGGLEVINSAAPAEHRGGVLSAIYLLAYVSLGAVSLLLGAVATAHGLGFAVDLGAGVIALFSVITVALVAMTRAGSLQIAIPSKSEGAHMIRTTPEQNKALVLEAFDTLFNKRDYDAASRFWSDKYIQHSAHIEPGREGLFGLIRSLPDSLRYEHGLILAEGDYVIVHGRFSGHGQPAAWVAADVVRIENGVLAEHWDVLQDEATKADSKSGLPMFGDRFPHDANR